MACGLYKPGVQQQAWTENTELEFTPREAMGKGENVCLKHTMTFRDWERKGTRGFTQQGGTTMHRLWTAPRGKGRLLQNLARAVPEKLRVMTAGLQTGKGEVRATQTRFSCCQGGTEGNGEADGGRGRGELPKDRNNNSTFMH